MADETCGGCGGFGTVQTLSWELTCKHCQGSGKQLAVVVGNNAMWRPSDGCDFAALDAVAQRDRNHILSARRDWKLSGTLCRCEICNTYPNAAAGQV